MAPACHRPYEKGNLKALKQDHLVFDDQSAARRIADLLDASFRLARTVLAQAERDV